METTGTTPDRVRALAPALAGRAADIERERRLPGDVLAALSEAGCLRMAVPAAYGGDDLDLANILQVVEAVAAADGAAGWVVGQAVVAQIIFAYFPRATVEEVYAAGPDVIGAGAVAPKGRAERDGDGWRVSGRWPFVTGCHDATWVYLHCMVLEQGRPRLRDGGVPELRLVLLPAGEVRVLDTWRSMGLRGTASHDVQVTRVHCPGERTAPFAGARPSVAGAALGIHARDLGGAVVAACVLGIAHGALEETVALAGGGKRRAFSLHRLAGTLGFQDGLGQAAMTLGAARALLHAEVTATAAEAERDGAPSLRQRARLRAAGPEAVRLAVEATTAVYTLAGGQAVYDDSPLQRRLRDAHTATQHFAVGRDFYAALGATLVGEDPGTSLL